MKALSEASGGRVEALLGNHDLHLLAVAAGVQKRSRSDTLDEILAAPDRDELIAWLRRRPLAMFVDAHLLVHAGVPPQWTAEQTMALAGEVEAVLRGDGWTDFLGQMYGNEPDRWDDGLTGIARLRCIVNALTRMRLCWPDGRMDFLHKESDKGPEGQDLQPWFDLPGRRTAGRHRGVRPLVGAGPGAAAEPDRPGQRLRVGREADGRVPGRPVAAAGGLSGVPASTAGRSSCARAASAPRQRRPRRRIRDRCAARELAIASCAASRQLAPVRALRRDRRQAVPAARVTGSPPRMRTMLSHERGVADVVDRRMPAAGARRGRPAQRLHRHAGVDRRLEQVGVERQQAALAGRGPLREEGHALALAERVHQSLEDVAQVAPVAARDEHGAGLRDQPAEHRPGADLGLGHEAAGMQRH